VVGIRSIEVSVGGSGGIVTWKKMMTLRKKRKLKC
jgi:hypothetical protein